MTSWEIKMALHAAAGVWVVDPGTEHDIEAALRRAEAVIAEVAAGSGDITIHPVPVDELDTFGALSAWTMWQTAGRDGLIDSTFYRLDIQPVEMAHVSRFTASGGTAPPSSASHSCFGLPLRRPPQQR